MIVVVVLLGAELDMQKIKAGKPEECGAIACAIGWASLMPEFRAEGLKWKPKAGNLFLHDELMTYGEAAQLFFGLPNLETAEDLFGALRTNERARELKDFAAFDERLSLFFVHHGEHLYA